MSQQLTHISDRAWSSYKESDYSISQWHDACLVHDHTGPPTSKAQCKLPVKTPNGAVNSNGVQAAAAALAGARGGVKDVSQDQRASAITALKGYYKDMGKELPPSLQHSSVEEFLSHHGVKGQKWGIRNRIDKALGFNKPSRRPHPDHKQAAKLRSKHVSELGNDELKKLNERLNLEANYSRLNPSKAQRGRNAAKEILASAGTVTALTALVKSKGGHTALLKGKDFASKALFKIGTKLVAFPRPI